MSFEVPADAYGRFMGRFSEPLAEQFVALADVAVGQRALDVGCGPGALTAQLVARLGPDAVSAVDPSEPFVAAVRARLPGVDVQLAGAEELPYADDGFDVALAQLVVQFMTDPVAGLTEMARVTRPGGLVGACVWGQGAGIGPLSLFWQAVRDLDPQAQDESARPGTQQGQLAELFEQIGLMQVQSLQLTVRVSFSSVQQWWEPYTLGVGPPGAYVAGLDAPQRDELRERCAELLPSHTPFEISASAWTALGRTP